MAISLYDLSVTSFLQTVGAVEGFLAKGLKHFEANGVDPQTIVETRLYPDMAPLHFQIASVAHHSLGAIQSAMSGAAGPPTSAAELDYAGLQALVKRAGDGLRAVQAEAVNSLEGRDVVFKFGDFKIPFVAEGFLMSFALPNVHFHATTAYDILRHKGVPLGKRDYLGALRVKS